MDGTTGAESIGEDPWTEPLEQNRLVKIIGWFTEAEPDWLSCFTSISYAVTSLDKQNREGAMNDNSALEIGFI